MLQHKTVILELFAAVCSKWYSRRFKRAEKPAITRLFSSLCSYSYDSCNRLSKLTCGTGNDTWEMVYTYDNNGNALTYRGASLTWEGKQLAGYTKGTDSLSFAYDDNGLRLSKTHNNETTSYYYNGSVLMSLVKGNDTLLFSYDQGGNVVSVNYNGTDYYYLRNGQGDIVKLIDGSGSTVVEYSYNSWGEQTGCTGTLSTALGTLNPFRYRGYVYDEETGLYYLQSRYYDPDLCRFISADVFLSTGQGVLGCNAFAYCGNEPIIFADYSGNKEVSIDPFSFGTGLLLGSIATAAGTVAITSSAGSTGIHAKVKLLNEPEDILSGIASKYEIYKCKEAAKAMQKELKKRKVDFDVVVIQFVKGNGIIWSDIANKTISENGIHVGIRVNGIVFCNVHSYGLPQKEWEEDFHGTGIKTITYYGSKFKIPN